MALISRRQKVALLVALISLGAVWLPFATRAASPAGGTLSAAGQTLTYTSGPLSGANPTAQAGAPVCTAATPCDDYALTVTAPAGFVGSYNVRVNVGWNNVGSDFDLYVLNAAGAIISTSASSSNPERLIFPVEAGTNTYTVRTVVFAAANDTITGTINFAPIPVQGAAGNDPIEVVNYPAPPGVGDDAGEPSIGSNWLSGKVLYYGGFLSYMLRVTFDDTQVPARATWEQKDLLLASTPRALGDPILFTDHQTGRTFISQLEGGTKQNTMDVTDNDGDTLQASVGSGINSGVDHQTVGGGPFARNADGSLKGGLTQLPGQTYPNAVYYCAQDDVDANCAVSLDGGITFGPAVPIYTLLECRNIHGHLKVAPDGTAYVPDNGCGTEQAVIATEDNGIHWEIRRVTGSTPGAWDPSVGIGTDGTLYFGYVAGDDHARISVSHDRGHTWSNSYDVGTQLGIKNIVFPAVVAGDPDRAAFTFFGTTTGGVYDDAAFPGVWYLYVASTFDGGATWTTVNATPNDPIQRGRICASGTACAAPGGGGDTRNLLDFFDATVDKQGRVLVGYDDGCITQTCINGGGNDFTAKATIARQSGGKRLFAAYDVTGPVQYPPVAQDDAATTQENTATTVDVLANDTDANGDALTISAVTQGAHGSVTNNGANVTYRPNANYNGADEFTYTVSDATGLSDTATVKITVNPFCPFVPSGSFFDNAETDKPGYTTSNTRTTGGWTRMLDATAHSPTNAYVALDEQPGVPTGTPKDASLTLPAQDLGATSKLNFWHSYDFARFLLSDEATAYQSGGVLEISKDGQTWKDLGPFISTGGYTGVVDAGSMSPLKGRTAWVGSSDGTMTPGRVDAMKQVSVNLGAAIQQLYGVQQLRGAKLRFRLGGTFQLLLGGIQGNGWGVDDIEVTNTLVLSNCNRPPVANDDAANTSANLQVRVNVLANDTDPENDVLTVSSVTQPAHGTATVNSDNTVTYAPASNYTGSDAFTYTISDGRGNAATAKVTITVTAPPNRAPTAANDSATTRQDTAVNINVIANDTDPDGDALTVVSFSNGAHGAVTKNADGTLKYTPTAGYYGSDSFGYTISDGRNGTASATVSVTITRVVANRAPDAVDDSATTTETVAVRVNLLANDTDPDGDALTVSTTTHGAHGTVVNNGDGTATYTPDAGFVGTDYFTYTISDGRGGSDRATVTVIVNQRPGTTGKVTGGGWIADGNGGKNNFGFNAQYKGATKGNLEYDSKAGGVTARGDVTSVQVSGQQADFAGPCQLKDGTTGRYTVHVEDLGEPGKGVDRFTIKVYNGLGTLIHSATGTLGGGNIQVH